MTEVNRWGYVGSWRKSMMLQLQSRFISGLRNDTRRFVLARDPNNLEDSINAALIEEQNVKFNRIANDERTGLSPFYTETSVISALTNKLEEINLRVERLQEASSVTARKTGGVFLAEGRLSLNVFIVALRDISKRNVGKEGRKNSNRITNPLEKRRGRIFCFPPPKHSFFRPTTRPFPRLGFSR
ncbi:hypothetical protein TNCV_3364461 [Trichonephila clavipes]|nr:hypothetical protein TNCV_3364461 [Trichonephila clavipes]